MTLLVIVLLAMLSTVFSQIMILFFEVILREKTQSHLALKLKLSMMYIILYSILLL